MSIYKPNHSKNYICVFKVRGQWFRKSTGTSNRKEAELKEREFRKQFIDENRGLRQQISFGKALDIYI